MLELDESESDAECGIPVADAVAAIAVIALAMEHMPGEMAVAGCGTVVEGGEEEGLLPFRPFVVDMSGADHLRSESGCIVDVITSGNCTWSLPNTVPVLRAFIRRSSSSNTSSIRFAEWRTFFTVPEVARRVCEPSVSDVPRPLVKTLPFCDAAAPPELGLFLAAAD